MFRAFVNPYSESSHLQISSLSQPSLKPYHSHRFIFEIQSGFDFEAPPPPPSAPSSQHCQPCLRERKPSCDTISEAFLCSSHLSGDKISPKSASPQRRSEASSGNRTPFIVSPKVVYDSQNSQTCLDPDASRVKLIFLQSVLGIILGGGAGTRLYPLTKKRAKLVPLGANYRLIDIPVRNCLNRNISKIYVLTQFNSASLNHHLSWAYTSNMGGYKNEGFVEVLAAQQSPKNPNWFQGTADAVRQYLWLFEEHNVLEFLILTGDQNFGSSIPNLLLDCCQGTYDEFHLQLIDYNPDVLDESVLWTESRDLGDGHRTIRMVNNIRLNVDAFNGDKNHGGVHDGTTIVLWERKKGDNQRWKIVPYLILWSSQWYCKMGGNASGEESDNIDWDTEDELEIQNFPFAVFGATKLWQLQQVLDACKMELNPEIIADIDKHTIVMKLLYYDDVTLSRDDAVKNLVTKLHCKS
ncbi:unnamed protein product [Camellia sinensis]